MLLLSLKSVIMENSRQCERKLILIVLQLEAYLKIVLGKRLVTFYICLHCNTIKRFHQLLRSADQHYLKIQQHLNFFFKEMNFVREASTAAVDPRHLKVEVCRQKFS